MRLSTLNGRTKEVLLQIHVDVGIAVGPERSLDLGRNNKLVGSFALCKILRNGNCCIHIARAAVDDRHTEAFSTLSQVNIASVSHSNGIADKYFAIRLLVPVYSTSSGCWYSRGNGHLWLRNNGSLCSREIIEPDV